MYWLSVVCLKIAKARFLLLLLINNVRKSRMIIYLFQIKVVRGGDYICENDLINGLNKNCCLCINPFLKRHHNLKESKPTFLGFVLKIFVSSSYGKAKVQNLSLVCCIATFISVYA